MNVLVKGEKEWRISDVKKPHWESGKVYSKRDTSVGITGGMMGGSRWCGEYRRENVVGRTLDTLMYIRSRAKRGGKCEIHT